MAASNVVRSLLSAALIASRVMAGTVSPSNLTESDASNILRLTGGTLIDARRYTIEPLTTTVGKGGTQTVANAITFSGNAVLADYATTSTFTSNDVVMISCDPNGSNIDASTIVGNVADKVPRAIVLYTTTSASCELTTGYSFTSMFTMVSSKDAQSMLGTIRDIDDSLTATIGTNGSSTTGSSTGSTTANASGPASTTAVAMSILYSITGVITLLFLGVIATGAVRAHRHPERYGPRIGFAGRPRQSRAKGLAKAMLETLPIVKFGDPEPAKPTSDVELESGNTHTRDASVMPRNTIDEAHPNDIVESGMGAAQAESVQSDEPVVREGDLGCSICTEDFTTGEDVRVLPCNHKYHPACIDPWLLNFSGTCPLCRHDLRPSTSAIKNTEGGTNGDELPPPLSRNEGNETDIATADDAPQRRHMSRFVDLRRLRNSPPDERIAALRRLREQSQREPAVAVDNTEEMSRRARLTGRLRDTFRVRTRTVNDVNTNTQATTSS